MQAESIDTTRLPKKVYLSIYPQEENILRNLRILFLQTLIKYHYIELVTLQEAEAVLTFGKYQSIFSYVTLPLIGKELPNIFICEYYQDFLQRCTEEEYRFLETSIIKSEHLYLDIDYRKIEELIAMVDNRLYIKNSPLSFSHSELCSVSDNKRIINPAKMIALIYTTDIYIGLSDLNRIVSEFIFHKKVGKLHNVIRKLVNKNIPIDYKTLNF